MQINWQAQHAHSIRGALLGLANPAACSMHGVRHSGKRTHGQNLGYVLVGWMAVAVLNRHHYTVRQLFLLSLQLLPLAQEIYSQEI